MNLESWTKRLLRQKADIILNPPIDDDGEEDDYDEYADDYKDDYQDYEDEYNDMHGRSPKDPPPIDDGEPDIPIIVPGKRIRPRKNWSRKKRIAIGDGAALIDAHEHVCNLCQGASKLTPSRHDEVIRSTREMLLQRHKRLAPWMTGYIIRHVMRRLGL